MQIRDTLIAEETTVVDPGEAVGISAEARAEPVRRARAPNREPGVRRDRLPPRTKRSPGGAQRFGGFGAVADLSPSNLRLLLESEDRRLESESLFCLATYIRTGHEIPGVHVAHLRFSNAAAGARNPGLQRKPDDRWTLPLSPNEHRRQHAMGEAAYWAELGVDPHSVACGLWAASPQVEIMLMSAEARCCT